VNHEGLRDWESFYRRSHTTEPTAFATWTLGRLDQLVGIVGAIVDLACGNGRDTFHFSHHGHAAIGIDRSTAAIKAATEVSRRRPGPWEPPTFVTADLSSAECWHALGDFVSTAGPTLFYGRFLLHAMSPDERSLMLEHLGAALCDDDAAVFEFRIPIDEGRPKLSDHRRWYLDPDALREQMARFGISMAVDAVGSGLAVMSDEDPIVARVTMRRSQDPRPGDQDD
jgi:SAM-dependent methyltransferase